MREQLRAVVTGAGSGLGRALALEIASRGGRVVAADIDEASAAETAQQIQAAGGQAHAVRCDVGEAAQVDQLAETARSLLGEIDLVANNAGVAVSGPFTDISTTDWEWIMRVNLWGVIHGCRAFLPAMKARRRGYVINVASLSGLMSAPQMSPYNVTKSAVVALSETLYGEYRNHGVHVSVLCPSFFVTKIIESGRGKPDPRMTRRAAAFMRRSSVQAPEVARLAVDGVLDGQLYIVPMRHARVLWRMQRFWPDGFYRFLTGKLGSLPDLD